MSNQRTEKAWHQQAREAVMNLKNAIKTAPIDEIRAVLEEDLGFNAQWNREPLRDRTDDLMTRAMLADPKAIRELFCLHATMTEMLTRLGWVDPTLTKGKDGLPKENQKTPPADTSPTNTWREEVNRAANILYHTVESNPKAMERELQDAAGKLPPAEFSFPLDRLIGAAEPPDNYTRLVSDLCDRLIQRRLSAECKRVIDALVEGSAERPPLPPGLGAKPRTDSGPTELTREIYLHLEHERTRFRTDEEREELSEELQQMCSARKLPDQITAKRKQREQEAGNNTKQDLNTESRSEKSADTESASYITTWRQVDEEIGDTIRIESETGSQIIVNRAELYEEVRIKIFRPNKIFQKKKADKETTDKEEPVETLPHFFEMHRCWVVRAALLPPLSKDSAVIEKWVDAALFWVISLDRGNLEDISWADPIRRRVLKTGSYVAGIRLFLREGFETLAGKDRRK